MRPLQRDGRSHGSVRHQRTSTEALRAPGAWSLSLLASRSLLWNSQRSGPESASRGTRPPGEIIPEWWAASSRNGWAASSRNNGRLRPESACLLLLSPYSTLFDQFSDITVGHPRTTSRLD